MQVWTCVNCQRDAVQQAASDFTAAMPVCHGVHCNLSVCVSEGVKGPAQVREHKTADYVLYVAGIVAEL